MAKQFKDIIKFKELLKKAIGNRTQAEFAKEIGINPVSLSRIMNGDTVPKKETLVKISGHSNGINLNRFLDVCGYELEETNAYRKELETLSVDERVAKNVESMIQGFNEMKNHMYKNIYEYCDFTFKIFAKEDMSIDEKEKTELTENEKEEFEMAEMAEIVQLSWENDKFSAVMDICIFFCETKFGAVYINDVACDSRTVGKYGSDVVSKMAAIGTNIGDNPAVLIRNFTKKNEMTAEEKFLRDIFGTPNAEKPTTPTIIKGIGFSVDEDLEYVFKEFIKNHKKAFCKSDKEKKIYQHYIEEYDENDKLPLEEYFHGYEADNSSRIYTSVWGTAIANIIFRETKLNVTFCDNSELLMDDKYDKENLTKNPYLIFTFRAPWEYNNIEKEVSEQFVTDVLDQYARELRSEAYPVLYKTYI